MEKEINKEQAFESERVRETVRRSVGVCERQWEWTGEE